MLITYIKSQKIQKPKKKNKSFFFVYFFAFSVKLNNFYFIFLNPTLFWGAIIAPFVAKMTKKILALFSF